MTIDPRFLQCRFERRYQWEEDAQNNVIVLRPRMGESRIGLWLASFARSPYYQIRLDAIGSLVWKNCDGKTSAAVITDRLRQAFGTQIEPAEERLHEFIMNMQRAGMIDLRLSIHD